MRRKVTTECAHVTVFEHIKECVEEVAGGKVEGRRETAVWKVDERRQVLGPQSKGGMIVLVTDGEENRDPRILDVTPSIQKAGVTVNAVAFGDKASIHLEQLIKATGGVGFYFNTTENTTAKIDMAFLSSMTSQYDVKEQPVTVIWTMDCRHQSTSLTAVFWVVTSEPKDSKNQPVRLKSWIGDLELTFPKVARVYAQVSKGYQPVLGAHIVATVDRPMGSLVDIVLLDNGAGADGTRNDGIYSAYFTQFNGDGRYSVVAQVVNNGQAGVRIKRRPLLSRSPPLPKPSHLSAQSKIKERYDKKHQQVTYKEDDLVWVFTPVHTISMSEKLLKGYFGLYRVIRKISRINYQVEGVTDTRRRLKTQDIIHVVRMKPYHDLKAQDEIAQDHVTRMWCFSVSFVEVRFGENLKALLKNFTSSKVVVEKDLVDGTLNPPPPGHYHEISIKIPISLEEPKTVFFAVVGVDASGNRAESFSIFPANLGILSRDSTNFTLAWKIGVAIILLVTVISIVLVALYFFRRRQKDKTLS
ncbi:hypothetical protein LAZ67_13002938, partial [Cordylochernes scorpioides]